MKHILLAATAFVLVACSNNGERHQANVYGAAQVNQRQEVKTINIISIERAKVEVDNSRNRQTARSVGALLGAVLGAGVAHNDRLSGAAAGGLAGNVIGNAAQGNTALVDGVQIIYQENGRVLSSAQIGRPCDYAMGAALVIVTEANETRIQSNHDCVEGQENAIGSVSKLGTAGLASINADQDTLDDLDRERTLLGKKREVQTQRTGLGKETRRTENAEESADLELEAERARVDHQRAINQATRDGFR